MVESRVEYLFLHVLPSEKLCTDVLMAVYPPLKHLLVRKESELLGFSVTLVLFIFAFV